MRLMIVGQLEGHISTAGKIALQRGAKVIHCEDTVEALGALRNGKGADLAMVDIKQNIGAFIKDLEKERIHIPVIACGIGTNDTRGAVKAIADGAREYVPLPPDADLIAAILAAVTEDHSAMIADDPAMGKIVALADKIAPSEATVLITGESGTGKEVMSQYIHRKSRRTGGPFIALNCAAIPETLLESELFGHEKGAFTGATARRIGKFEEAHGGTLLLDEVTEMHPALQAKLLRALQEREITRVGANDPVKVDVRIIATSNRDMMQAVRDGQFREDLYFRLNVVNIPLPALRERPSDIVKLAQFFADKYADANGIAKKDISAAAANALQTALWRGNIRELENTMHRAILISAAEEIEPDAVFLDAGSHPPLSPPSRPKEETERPALQNPGAVESLIGRPIADVERDMIIGTLAHCLGNRTHAANILGISIRTLRNKLSQYKDEGVPVPAAQ
ncbi:MAG: sigma-54-dependent Fis family transcriptional regulator [Alphaproteobacteria bacterium]|nr:sigma-54-dependent Fis family transcriptional regulator [Alphaproteobacteria bacterium]